MGRQKVDDSNQMKAGLILPEKELYFIKFFNRIMWPLFRLWLRG